MSTQKNFLLCLFFAIINNGDNMKKQKIFLTIDELIKNIKEKNINIKDENNVRHILETNNYYFIMGYKFAFKNQDGTYKENTSFEDIYALYIFDKLLKLIILDPLLEIEQKLKTIYNNNYSSRYGFKKENIIDSNNYDTTNDYLSDTLTTLQNQLDNFGDKNKAVMFYKNNHSFVPLWVYMKILSFGTIRDMFYVSKASDKDYMKNKLTKENVNSKEIANILRLLVRVRNICCHDDILISFVDEKLGIKNTKYHRYFNLKKDNKGNIIQGKKDLFAIIISIKLLLDKEKFDILINNLSDLITEFDEQIGSLNRKQLLEIMHLPSNFEKLKEL